MIIVKLIGGLGNQMFQYAVGRSLAEKQHTSLQLDISGYAHQVVGNTPRYYSLDCFQILAQPVTVSCWRLHWLQFRQHYQREVQFNFNPAIFQLRSGNYLEGYWQTEKYFNDITELIRHDFTLQLAYDHIDPKLRAEIKNSTAVSVHVRRGDYITNQAASQFHGLCDLGYYRRCVQYIINHVTQPHWFVFSDDIEWTKENLLLPGKVTYVSNGKIKDYEELTLMSYCKHHIIANSSFSWWGAWLNASAKKIVLAPKQWFIDTKINTSDILPATWIKL
ncbi:MAG: alpha-1,2-fucosyltransferase [Patescibacteria group bacterium]|jgi:hypothetical protein